MQFPLQSASQLPEQLKLPGLAVQLAEQLVEQAVVQSTVAVAMQPPLQVVSSCAEQLASTLTGVQSPVHVVDVSKLHDSLPEKSMLPQSVSTVAWAVAELKATRAPIMTAVPAAKNDERENMESLLLSIVAHAPASVERGARAHAPVRYEFTLSPALSPVASRRPRPELLNER